MCTQRFDKYKCGCQIKGTFVQCERLYNAQSNMQCNAADVEIIVSRNYCARHMPKEPKATTEYIGRVRR